MTGFGAGVNMGPEGKNHEIEGTVPENEGHAERTDEELQEQVEAFGNEYTDTETFPTGVICNMTGFGAGVNMGPEGKNHEIKETVPKNAEHAERTDKEL